MTAKERLKRFVEFKHIGRNKFEEKVGISFGYISSRSPTLGSEIIEKILKIYPDINIEWLITGEGEMTRSTTEKEKNIKIKFAPLISRYAHSSYLVNVNSIPFIKSLPVVPVLADNNDPRDFYAFEMRGESMNDGSINSFKSGDILICKEVDSQYWSCQLNSSKGKTFILVHETEGVLVKQVADFNQNDSIVLRSINPVFSDIRINVSDIKKMFSIIKIHRDQF